MEPIQISLEIRLCSVLWLLAYLRAKPMLPPMKINMAMTETIMRLNAINRTACSRTVRTDHVGLLGQNGLCVNGDHAERCDDPHPEYDAGASDEPSFIHQ